MHMLLGGLLRDTLAPRCAELTRGSKTRNQEDANTHIHTANNTMGCFDLNIVLIKELRDSFVHVHLRISEIEK